MASSRLCVFASWRLGVKFRSPYCSSVCICAGTPKESPGSREAAKAYSPGFQSRVRTTTDRFEAPTERRYEARSGNDDVVPSLINEITTRVVPRRSCALFRALPSRTRCVRGLKPPALCLRRSAALGNTCAALRHWEMPAPLRCSGNVSKTIQRKAAKAQRRKGNAASQLSALRPCAFASWR